MIIIINPHETIKQNAGDIRKDKNELKRVVNNLIDEGKIDVRSSPTEAMLAEDIICTMNNIEEMIYEKMSKFTNDEKEELINDIHDIMSQWNGWEDYYDYMEDIIITEVNEFYYK